jgi:hypothetical protein
MKFGSVQEYFSKLYSIGFQRMMVPLILFIVYYGQWIIKMPALAKFDRVTSEYLLIFTGCLNVIVLTAVQILTKKKANRIAREVGLGIKLEKLGTVLTAKMTTLSILILLMPLLLLFTDENYFAMTFGLLSLWYFFQWPTPGRVSRLLKLKGDEKVMVISRGAAFK